ncbi:PilN domain-containing protein [Parahaliea maris]|nr:PilN domain-containing protein [Parahaliea maris]
MQVEGLARLGEFWDWWLGELKPLVPDWVRRAFAVDSARLLVRIQGGDVIVTLEEESGLRELGSTNVLELDEAGVHRFHEELESGVPDNVHVVVVLSLHDLLSRDVFLPLAAEQNLATAIRFELDRLMPYRKGITVFGYSEPQRLEAREQLKVNLFCMERARLARLLEKLRALGLAPGAVVPETDDWEGVPTLNMLEASDRQPERTLWDAPLRKAGLICLSLVLAALIFPAWQFHRQSANLTAAIAENRDRAELIAAKRNALRSRQTAQEVILSRLRTDPGKLELLSEITRLLPDDTWVARFDIDEARVFLQGESSKASDLVEILEESPYLENVQFRSPVIRNQRTGMEQYELDMTLSSEGV